MDDIDIYIQSEWVFKTGNIHQIASVIEKMINSNDKKNISIRNFSESKEYDFSLLEERRNNFFIRAKNGI